jgi:hypothetical protein
VPDDIGRGDQLADSRTNSTDSRAVLTQWVEGFVAERLRGDEFERAVLRLDGEISAAVPEFAADEELQQYLHPFSCSSGVRSEG